MLFNPFSQRSACLSDTLTQGPMFGLFIQRRYQMKHIAMISLVLAGSLSIFGSAQASDVDAGKARYSSCISCHGALGQGNLPTFPALQGKSSEELATLLKKYRAGEVNSPMAGLMNPQAANLSDGDIANLAAYIATL
jgi:cytochrome c553